VYLWKRYAKNESVGSTKWVTKKYTSAYKATGHMHPPTKTKTEQIYIYIYIYI